MATQCLGMTLKKTRCRRLVNNVKYCYLHLKENTQPEERIWDEESRIATCNDVAIFELVAKYLCCYNDIWNLCLVSRRFLERTTTNTFNSSIRTLIENIFLIDISSIEASVIAKSLGFTDRFSKINNPTNLHLFGLITYNYKPKTKIFCKRGGKLGKLIVSGMEMLEANLFHGQTFISEFGTGRFVGFDEDNRFFWYYLNKDGQKKTFADEIVRCYEGVRNREDCTKSGIIMLE